MPAVPVRRSRESISYYQRAIEVDPGQNRYHLNLGNAYLEVGLLDQAVEAYRRALELNPSDTGVLHNLAIGLRLQGFLEQSLACSESALAISPDCRNNFFAKMFTYSTSRLSGSAEMLAAARRGWDRALMADSGPDLLEPSNGGMGLSVNQRKFRIGLLSGEVGEHCVSTFIHPLLEYYSRDRFEIEIISTVARSEERALVLSRKADDSFVLNIHDPDARSFVRGRRYDLILETSGYTDHSALPVLASRCAPIQCHYIGFHASTGLGTIDYFIGDHELTPPEFEVQFHERLWRLPRAWLASIPYEDPPRAFCGVDSSLPILAAFSQISKIGPDTIRYWAAAMRRVPSARLLIKDKYANSRVACERILSQLADHQIDPQRVCFMPRDLGWHEHMARYNEVDLALDTTPWSSATTAFDALSMGVPMVAIRGNCTASRMSSSIIKASGHSEWVVTEPMAFADVVESLLGDLDGLREGKGSLQRQILASPLFDAKDMARHLENAFEQMVRRQRI